MSDLFAIGEAAERAGVSVRALRYYQEMGLLTPSGRTAGGNRLYSGADLERVRRIRELQELLGFNLDEVRSYLTDEDRLAQVKADYWSSSQDADRRQLLVEALDLRTGLRDRIDAKIERLGEIRAEMDAAIANVHAALDRVTPAVPHT